MAKCWGHIDNAEVDPPSNTSLQIPSLGGSKGCFKRFRQNNEEILMIKGEGEQKMVLVS